MGESVAKSRQHIDVEEFERRLRVNEQPDYDDSDPLAELARLVEGSGIHDRGFAAPPPPPPPVVRIPEVAPPEPIAVAPIVVATSAPPVAPPPQAAPTVDDWEVDLKNWEAELRGGNRSSEPFEQRVETRVVEPPQVSIAPPPPPPAPPMAVAHESFEPPEQDYQPFEAGEEAAFDTRSHEDFDPAMSRQEHVVDADAPRDLDEYPGGWRQPESAREEFTDEEYPAYQPAPKKSRLPAYLIGGAGLAIMGLVGGGFALRGGVTGVKGTPTILASPGPSKIQPEQQAKPNAGNPGSSVLDKSGEKIATSKVVNNEEQPVDINAQARAARIVGVNGESSMTAAAPGAAAPQSAPPSSNSFFPEPKRVKTVSVRPDGSVIDADAPPPPRAAIPQPPAPAASLAPAPTPVARPAAPLVAAATPVAPVAAQPAAAPPAAKPAAPKTTARVAPAPKPETTAATETTAIAAPGVVARPKPVPATPKPVATAAKPATAKPATPKPAVGGGGFAVQFAAAGSEAEARGRIAKVNAQYASALDGHRAGVVRGEANGKTVYRVRAGGMTREAATAMCVKIKEAGGACFVAGS